MALSTDVTRILIDLVARDKATKTLLKSAATIGTLGYAIGKFARESIQAYSESEDAQNRLSFAYAKFPKLADVSLQSLDDLTQAMQKKTRFDDESLKSGEAVLAQFNLTGKQVESILPLIADYAASTGRDIPEAAGLVGKALLGNARALKLIGINFKATGDTGKDFVTIQGLINAKVGGFAEKEGKTAAGQAKILANQYNELQESVGAALVPALQKLADILIPIVEDFNKLSTPVKQAIVLLGLAGVTALVVVPRILKLRAAWLEMRAAGFAAALGLEASTAAEVTAGDAAVVTGSKVDTMVTAIGRTAGLAALLFALSKGFGKTSDEASAADQAMSAFAGTDNAAKLKAITTQLQVFPDALGRSWSQLIQSTTHSDDVLAHLGVTAKQIADKAGASDTEWSKYRQSLLDASDAAGNNGSTTLLLARNLDLIRSSSLDAADSQKILGGTETATGVAIDAATGKVVAQHSALATLKTALLNAIGALEAKTLAQYDARDADATALAKIKELGPAHKLTGQQVRDGMRTFITAADAARDAVTGAANKDAAYRTELDHLRDKTKPGSPLRKALDAYIARLDYLNKTFTTKLDLSVAYTKAVAAGQGAANAAKLKVLGFDTGGMVPGPVGSPRLAVVHGGERVLTARESKATISPMTYMTVNIYTKADPSEVIRVIQKYETDNSKRWRK